MKKNDAPGKTQRDNAAASRRASRGRRRVDPATCDHDYTPDELEFLLAVQRYKETFRRPYPTLKEYLEIIHSLGYVKKRGTRKNLL